MPLSSTDTTVAGFHLRLSSRYRASTKSPTLTSHIFFRFLILAGDGSRVPTGSTALAAATVVATDVAGDGGGVALILGAFIALIRCIS
jgi:hypothetical protein